MSFSCPHFCPDEEHCVRLKTDCVPGRHGCVLGPKVVFATPVEERIRLREEEKRLRAAENYTAKQNPNTRAEQATKRSS